MISGSSHNPLIKSDNSAIIQQNKMNNDLQSKLMTKKDKPLNRNEKTKVKSKPKDVFISKYYGDRIHEPFISEVIVI